MQSNIAVIGCGNIGRRHIQGLGLSSSKIKVHVFDIVQDAIAECKVFCNDNVHKISNLEIKFYDMIRELGNAVQFFDLVIVASTATNRPKQLELLFECIHSKAWLLEKPICQSPEELYKLIKITKGLNVWVNHFRRIVPSYKDLKEKYFKGQKINISFSGVDIGIGCNVSHLIDLVNFLTDEFPTYVDTSGLSSEWHDAKREGFKEVDGTLKFKFSSGSTMSITSSKDLKNFKIKGYFIENGKRFVFDETEGLFTLQGKKIQFKKLPYQSELTGKIFDQIKQYGKSDLTSISLAGKCYILVIEALLSHWQSIFGQLKDRKVPIT